MITSLDFCTPNQEPDPYMQSFTLQNCQNNFIYNLVSEIHDNVDKVLGIKNVYDYEMEGVINTRFICTLPEQIQSLFLKNRCNIETKGTNIYSYWNILYGWISGIVMVKLLNLKTGGVNTKKVKVTRNVGFLQVINNSQNSSHSIGMKCWMYWIWDPLDIIRWSIAIFSTIWSHSMNSDHYRNNVRNLVLINKLMEKKKSVLLGIPKEGFSAYSSPITLTCRRLAHNKRCISKSSWH